MKSAAKFGLVLFSSLSFWLAVLIYAPIPARFYSIFVALPLWALVAFGSYSLASIGYSMLTFNECRDASEELKREVEMARAELTSKGLKW